MRLKSKIDDSVFIVLYVLPETYWYHTFPEVLLIWGYFISQNIEDISIRKDIFTAENFGYAVTTVLALLIKLTFLIRFFSNARKG